MSNIKKEVIYVSTGISSGYYHYAISLLKGFLNITSINVTPYFTDNVDKKELRPSQKTKLIGNSLLPYKVYRGIANLAYTIILCVKLLSGNVTVLHFNTIYYPLTTILLILVSNLRGIKTVLTVHELSPERLRKVGLVDRYLRRKCRALANIVIVHSENMKYKLVTQEGLSSVKVIDHGNYNIFKDMYGQRETGKIVRVIFFGVKKHKGIDAFVTAIEKLYQIRDDFEVIIAGRPNPGEHIDLSSLVSAKTVIILDKHIPDSELGQIFEKGSIAVMPYVSGDTSGALHLAMSFGCCPVVTDIPYFSELLKDGETGFFVNKNDPDSIVERLIYILDNPLERLRVAVNANRLENSERFNWDRIAREHLKVYDI